jgi:hypothetical protein
MHVEYRVFQLMCTIVRGDRAEAAAAAAVRLDEMTTRLFNCLGPGFMSKGSVQSLKLLLAAAFIKLALGRDAECLKVSCLLSDTTCCYRFTWQQITVHTLLACCSCLSGAASTALQQHHAAAAICICSDALTVHTDHASSYKPACTDAVLVGCTV